MLIISPFIHLYIRKSSCPNRQLYYETVALGKFGDKKKLVVMTDLSVLTLTATGAAFKAAKSF
jgi:hypothetical protein